MAYTEPNKAPKSRHKPLKPVKAIKPPPKPKKAVEGYDREEFEAHMERANSLINYLRSELSRLKVEIEELKSYKVWAAARITQISQEDERNFR